MHNVFVNQLKARKTHNEVEIDENAIAAPIPTATSVDILDLRAALLRLPAEQREVVLLIALEDMKLRRREPCARHSHRHRDVASVARPRAPAQLPWRARSRAPIRFG